MARLCGVLASCCIWLVACVPPTGAAQPPSLPPARAARTLARIIRRDARQQYRRSAAAVTVTRRCCGVRVLRVHYRAKASGDMTTDDYVLMLQTRRGILQVVAISESSTEAGYKPETGNWTNTWQDEFAIHHEDGWSFSAEDSDISSVEHGLGGRPSGEGFARECQLPAPVPRALYTEALLMLQNASRHVSSPGLLAQC